MSLIHGISCGSLVFFVDHLGPQALADQRTVAAEAGVIGNEIEVRPVQGGLFEIDRRASLLVEDAQGSFETIRVGIGAGASLSASRSHWRTHMVRSSR
jgi:hypothetical protein